MTGSSGLVGTALCAFLTTAGHRVIRLVRRTPHTDNERTWNPDDPDPRIFEGVDAVVHLAGASIAGRFTEAHKRAIASSRIEPTRRLADAMVRAEGPRVLLAASAIGYYGRDRGDELLDEGAGRGDGFLAEVVARWEAATDPARDAGLRVVTVRTGIVLSARGGMLKLLRPVFLAGLGGRIGDGRQWLSWIDLDDLTDVYARSSSTETSSVRSMRSPRPLSATRNSRRRSPTCCIGRRCFRSRRRRSVSSSEPTASARSLRQPAGRSRHDSSRSGSTSGAHRSRPPSATSWDAQHQRRDLDVSSRRGGRRGPSFLRRADGARHRSVWVRRRPPHPRASRCDSHVKIDWHSSIREKALGNCGDRSASFRTQT